MARNSHMVSFENLSHLSASYQDALCVLATGGGFAARTLYTNADETVLNVKKPVVLNGIAVIVTAQDLLDRTLHIDLPTITHRIRASELKTRFDTEKSRIFGALLTLFSRVMKVLPTIELEPHELPRMADFAFLGEAVYRVNGHPPMSFLSAYNAKRKDGIYRTIEASPVASAMLAYLEAHSHGYEGTVKGLLEQLEKHKQDNDGWPRSAKGFADALRRLSPALRMIGIQARIDEQRGKNGYRCALQYIRSDSKSLKQSTPSAPCTPQEVKKQVNNTEKHQNGEHGVLDEHALEVFSAKNIYNEAGEVSL